MCLSLKNVRLIKPTLELKDEYLNMIEEWDQFDDKIVPWVQNVNTLDFDEMVSKFEDDSHGIGIKEGYVPQSTYWLVRNDNKVLGVINIRHALNAKLMNRGGHIGYGVRLSERGKGYASEMLRLALKIVKSMEIGRVLITCDKKNIASARTIVGNGGILHSEGIDNGIVFQRYWIDLN